MGIKDKACLGCQASELSSRASERSEQSERSEHSTTHQASWLVMRKVFLLQQKLYFANNFLKVLCKIDGGYPQSSTHPGGWLLYTPYIASYNKNSHTP
jgi:hypothetical protein